MAGCFGDQLAASKYLSLYLFKGLFLSNISSLREVKIIMADPGMKLMGKSTHGH